MPAKVEKLPEELTCGCEMYDRDPYRVTMSNGEVFDLCDTHYDLLKAMLAAEGVTLDETSIARPHVPERWTA